MTVARALVGDPLIQAVMSLMTELHHAGATIRMVTHDPRYAAYSDRIIHLFDGRIVEESAEDQQAGD